MAWSYRGAGTLFESGGSANIVCGLPSGLTDGDVCLALIAHGGSAAPTTVPAGWELLDDGGLSGYHWAVYGCVADGLSGNQSWVWAAGGVAWGVILAWYGDGYDTSDPFVAIADGAYFTSDTTLRHGSLSLDAASDVIYAGITYAGGALTHTPPSGWDEDFDAGGSSVLCFGSAGHKTMPSGSTGTIDSTISASTSYKTAWLIALNPTAESDPEADVTVTITPADATADGDTVTAIGQMSPTVALTPGDALADGTDVYVVFWADWTERTAGGVTWTPMTATAPTWSNAVSSSAAWLRRY